MTQPIVPANQELMPSVIDQGIDLGSFPDLTPKDSVLEETPSRGISSVDFDASSLDFPDKFSSVEESYNIVAKQDPDQAAKIIDISNKTGLPREHVEKKLSEMIKTMQAPGPGEFAEFEKNYPGSAKWLVNPDNMVISKDDIDNVKRLEDTVKDHSTLTQMYKGFGSGLLKLGANIAKIPATTIDMSLLPYNLMVKYGYKDGEKYEFQSPDWLMNNPVSVLLDAKAEEMKPFVANESFYKNAKEGNYAKAGQILAVQAAENFPLTLGIILGSIYGHPEIGLSAAGATAAADAAQEGRIASKNVQGASPDAANQSIYSAVSGAAEVLFERMGTGRIAKKIFGDVVKEFGESGAKEIISSVAKTLAYGGIQEGKEEFGTQVVQSLTSYLTDVNPNALKTLIEDSVNAAAGGAFSGSVLVSPSAAAAGMIQAQQGKKAAMAKDFYLAHGKSVESLKARERLPESVRTLVEANVKESPVENVYISPEKFDEFFQSKETPPPAVADQLGITDEYNNAKANGTNIKIPLSVWSSKVSPEYYQALSEDIKFNEEDLTINEYHQLKKDLEQENKQDQETLISEKESSANEVEATVIDQLQRTRFYKEAGAYAALERERAVTRAERRGLGETPMQVFKLKENTVREADQQSDTGDKDLYQRTKMTPAEDAYFKVITENEANNRELMDQVPSFQIIDGAISIHENDLVAFKNFITDAWISSRGENYKVPPSFHNPQYLRFQIRKDDGSVVYKQGDGEARGSISISKAKAEIKLFEPANRSTYLHEMSHRFFDEIITDALTEGTPQQLRDDLDTVLEWLGLDVRSKDGEEAIRKAVKTEHHEKFAEGSETYFMKGKSPSSKLQSAFNKFKGWLVRIYKALKNRGVVFTDEVSEVMDRLVATDEAISEVMKKVPPLFQDPNGLGMNQEQYDRYVEAAKSVKESSEIALMDTLMEDIENKRTDEWMKERSEIKKRIELEISKMPIYQALDVLQKGVMPDGTKIEPFKLSKKSIIEQHGEEAFKRIKAIGGNKVWSASSGYSTIEAAELLGFSSADELITAIATTIPKEEYINRTADEEMLKLHPDILDSPQMSDETIEAYHNENRANLLRLELELMLDSHLPVVKDAIRRIAKRPPKDSIMKQAAEEEIGRLKVRDIRPYRYYLAERKAAKQAGEFLTKGDFAAAFEAKRRELKNFYLYKAALAGVESANKQAKFANRYNDNAVRSKIGKAGGDYLAQIDGLMDRHDFKRSATLRSIDKRQSIRDWYESQIEENLIEPFIPEKILDEAYSISYKDMTLSDLTDLVDSMKNIESLAKLKNELLTDKNKREFALIEAEAEAVIRGNAKKTIPRDIETSLPSQAPGRFYKSFLASHTKLATYMRQFDGWKDGGVMWNLFSRKLNDAADRESVAKEKATMALNAIFKSYEKDGYKKLYKRVFIPEINSSLSKMAMLMVALNSGSEDNFQKLKDGYDWTDEQVQSVLDMLDEKDWNFVKSIWSLVDSYWAETKALSERVTGISPPKIEGRDIVTRYGIVKGNYFRLKYNGELSAQAQSNDIKEMVQNQIGGAAVRATVRHGSRMERTRSSGLPVRLDFGTIFEHVSEVIHDQTHFETLIDLNRLLGSKKISNAIIDHYGKEVFDQLSATLRDVATGDQQLNSAFEKGINYLRTGITHSALGWKLTTAIKQPLGFAQSAARIGPMWLAHGMMNLIGSPQHMTEVTESVHQKSEFMRLRAKTFLKEINEIRNTVKKEEMLPEIKNSYFWFIYKMQQIVDTPTWLGAYEKALSELKPESDGDMESVESKAIAIADQAVRDAQGGGHLHDLAGIQRGGPLKKIFTTFYNFFNTTFQLNKEAINKDPGRMLVDLFLINSVPVLFGLVIDELTRGHKGDDDKDDLYPMVIREQISYLLAQLVGIREFAGVFAGYQGYEGPAGTRFFSEGIKLLKQTGQGEFDEAFVTSLNRTAGILFHYPAGQLEATIRGFDALQSGETKRPTSLLFGPPKK